jgi:hypothetical protein
LKILTYHRRIILVLIRCLFPAQVVVVVNGETAILVLPLALLGFLIRVCGKVVFRQVVGERHIRVSGMG